MPYSAWIELPCTCGAQCQVTMECDDDPRALRTLPVHCWKCDSKIGQVPAIAVTSEPALQHRPASLLRSPGARL